MSQLSPVSSLHKVLNDKPVALKRKQSNHHVEVLSAGLVFKIVVVNGDNAKLRKEVERINDLSRLFPQQIVPVLKEGELLGRYFYILERIEGSSLCDIVFSSEITTREKAYVVGRALEFASGFVEAERANIPSDLIISGNYLELILFEISAIKNNADGDFFLQRIFSLEGFYSNISLSSLFDRIAALSADLGWKRYTACHQNLHFGNILSIGDGSSFKLIDPDISLPGIDPLFGLARFAFSFWHELVAESMRSGIALTQEISSTSGSFTSIYSDMIEEIPALTSREPYIRNLSDDDRDLFDVLLFYCFVRSIRINWEARNTDSTPAQDILAMGCLAFFDLHTAPQGR